MLAADKKSGFTLIELMIVIGILGILASVAVPALVGYSRRAKTSEVANNLRNMYYSARSYFNAERYLRAGGVGGNKCLVTETGAGYLEPSVPNAVKQHFDATSHPSWLAMSYTIQEPVFFGYTFLTDYTPVGGGNCLPPGSNITPGVVYFMRAHGDLDGDGDRSTFELTIRIDSELELSRSAGLYINNEIE
jgi:prepilin-type N-terminal cleavage/methylation domain-containing protein